MHVSDIALSTDFVKKIRKYYGAFVLSQTGTCFTVVANHQRIASKPKRYSSVTEEEIVVISFILLFMKDSQTVIRNIKLITKKLHFGATIPSKYSKATTSLTCVNVYGKVAQIINCQIYQNCQNAQNCGNDKAKQNVPKTKKLSKRSKL